MNRTERNNTVLRIMSQPTIEGFENETFGYTTN
ncbi:MAG: hypothetical protein RLZZ308_107 [Candidatus Parcubacteria bacterium]|jgi:hypothetical protein